MHAWMHSPDSHVTSCTTGASVDTAGPEAAKVRVCMHALFELFVVFTHNSAIVRVRVMRQGNWESED